MLINAGLIIDGTSAPPEYNRIIAIEADRIVAVGRPADFAADQLGQAVDYSACTVLPGLIDCHVHLFLEGIADMKTRARRWHDPYETTLLRAAKNSEAALSKGVTTVRDLGGPGGITATLRQAVREKILAGPAILTCNRSISRPGGHFHYAGGREADGPTEIAKAVREQIKAGADTIKLMVTGVVDFTTSSTGGLELSAVEISAAVREAGRYCRRVSVHANGIDGVRQAIAAGVHTIEHGALLDEATVAALSDSPVYWVPTLAPFRQMLDYARDHPTASLPPSGLESVYSRHCAMVRQGIAAGAKIIAGTDAGALGVQHGDTWQEIALLAALGLSPLQAIAAATGLAAKALALEEVTGTIAAGKKADLLVIKGNPLQEMHDLQNVVQVYKDGAAVLAAPSV